MGWEVDRETNTRGNIDHTLSSLGTLEDPRN